MLTEEQEAKILKLFDKTPRIADITAAIFGPEKDGRSKEGRMIANFLKGQGLHPETTKSEAKYELNLTEEQKRILLSDEITWEMNAIDCARLIFKDDSIVQLSKQHITVVDFLRKYRPEVLEPREKTKEGEWQPPRSMLTCVRKVNKWCHAGLVDNVECLQSRHRKCIEKLLKYLQNYKLVVTINSFEEQNDKDLFESEFVRATWDKPDLTSDELNLYMMICSNQVRARYIQRRLDALNRSLQDMDVSEDGAEPTMRLTEYIKSTADELNQTEKRIESLITKLNGDRAKRIQSHREANENILFLVEEFQNEESRRRMVMMAEMQNKLITEEADRIESLSEMKARVFGVSKDELL